LRFGDDNKNEHAGNLYWAIQKTNVTLQTNSSSDHSALMLVFKRYFYISIYNSKCCSLECANNAFVWVWISPWILWQKL